MFWAEHEIGLANALEKLWGFAAFQNSTFYKVSPFLERLVAAKKGFAESDSP